jgi:hypothetical protein
MERRPVRLFLASPSDVGDERAAAREVIDWVNYSLGRSLGVFIDLFGWEQVPPDYGRPQDLINPQVDECDVFVGVLGVRWGTSTGIYSSGFEEEYQRALDRREASGDTPKLWLFLKEISSDRAADPGPQLQKVLDFHRRVKSERRLLYRTYDSIPRWREEFQGLLASYLVEHYGQPVSSEQVLERQAEQQPQSGTAARSVEEAAVRAAGPAEMEVLDTLDRFRAMLTTDDLASFIQGDTAPTFPHVERLLLFAQAWMSGIETGELLSAHEINTLYRRRTEFAPLPVELRLLRRTVIGAAPVGSCPGWYWLREPADELAAELADLVGDSNEGVRAQSLRSLGLLRHRPEGWWSDSATLAALLADKSEQVRAAALSYIDAVAEPPDSELLGQLAEQVEDERAELRVRAVLVRPDCADEEIWPLLITEGQIATQVNAERSLAAVANAPSDVTSALVRATDKRLREAAIRRASGLGVLDPAELGRALAARSAQVRAAAVDAIISSGLVGIEEAVKLLTADRPALSDRETDDDLAAKVLQGLPEELLRERSKEMMGNGHVAYRALATYHFENFGEQLRSDLAERFNGLVDEYNRTVEEQYGAEAAERYGLASNRSLREFAVENYARAALAGVRLHGTADDAQVIRTFLTAKYPETRLAAGRALQRIGSREDAPAIIAAARESYLGDKAELVGIALALSPALDGAPKLLLAEEDSQLLQRGIEAIDRTFASEGVTANTGDWPRHEVLARLQELCSHDDDSVRAAAARALCSALSSDDLEGFLNEYISRPSYYYNVVVVIDQHLYAS